MVNTYEWLQHQQTLHVIAGIQLLPETPLPAIPNFPLSGNLTDLPIQQLELFYQRAERLRERYPDGLPKRHRDLPPWWRRYISAKNLTALYPALPMPSAKRTLDNLRFLCEKLTGAKITVKEFCYITAINEEDTHLHLAQLTSPAYQPKQPPHAEMPLPDDPDDPLDAFPGFPLSGDLTKLDPDTHTLLYERARRFRLMYPYGEPFYKSFIPYRMYIYTRDIMALHYPMSLRSAQRTLENIRVYLEKPKNYKVTVKEYCQETGANEDIVREFLNQLDEQREKDGEPPIKE